MAKRTIPNGAAIALGLTRVCGGYARDAASIAHDLYAHGEDEDAKVAAQLSASLVTVVQLVEMLSPRLLIGNSEAAGIPETH